ncbi:MAG: exodeoxyribonuclease VII large subunit [Thermodesulfobacteriota bacterium]
MNNLPSFKDIVQKKIYGVSELNSKIKSIVEDGFDSQHILVAGEISNFNGNYVSGHWYFSLKDEQSQISAVSFKWANSHIKFTPENGMEVICNVMVSVYEKGGTYQLNVKHIEPKGVGAQALALEQLKEKLLKEGLFDIERKRPLPYLPQKIGIATSPTGAAVKDIIKVITRRFPNIHILISPTRVQGENAPSEIIKALEILYKIKDLDLIILTRGGGSKEDLWVFNDETLARTIIKSPVPLISAVGHEIDITISDLVADIRAATPSMAAELAVKEKTELIYELSTHKKRMDSSLKNKVNQIGYELDQYVNSFKWNISSKIERIDSEIRHLSGKLDSLSPLKVLSRGYSIVTKIKNNKVITDSKKIKENDKLELKFHIGKAVCEVIEIKE